MTYLVKPAPGRKVRRPDQGFRPLQDEGELVNQSPYWDRALLEGDVVPVDQAVADVATDPAAKKAAKGDS